MATFLQACWSYQIRQHQHAVVARKDCLRCGTSERVTVLHDRRRWLRRQTAVPWLQSSKFRRPSLKETKSIDAAWMLSRMTAVRADDQLKFSDEMTLSAKDCTKKMSDSLLPTPARVVIPDAFCGTAKF